jgi:hypothetical protein
MINDGKKKWIEKINKKFNQQITSYGPLNDQI